MPPLLRSQPAFALVAVLSLASPAVPSKADDPRPPSQGTLYLGQGRMLEAAPPRQLTLGANAFHFAYQPGGLEIAYVGVQHDGDTFSWTVQLAGIRRGALATLMRDTYHIGEDGHTVEPDAPTLTLLGGWSGDGRYLLVQQSRFVTPDHPAFSGDFRIQAKFTVVDVGTTPFHLASVPLPETGTTGGDPVFWWSPHHSRLLFAAQGVFGDKPNRYVADTFCSVYDPLQDRLMSVGINDGQFAVGWLDETHLLLKQTKGGTTHFFVDDLTTGHQTESPAPKNLPAGLGEAEPPQASSPLSPKAPDLALLDEPRLLADPQQVTSQRAHALWVRRTQGPKPQSAAPVGLTPGRDDPQARWSPSGTQIAFLAHGDLFVTDLTTRAATPEEQLGAREPVNCAEERIRAGANLKQIGLAILQYAQDHDEQFPPANELPQSLGLYLKGSDVYALNGHHFVYHAPADTVVGHMTAPAAAVLGTMDLPCATITLYADGHVADVSKAGM